MNQVQEVSQLLHPAHSRELAKLGGPVEMVGIDLPFPDARARAFQRQLEAIGDLAGLVLAQLARSDVARDPGHARRILLVLHAEPLGVDPAERAVRTHDAIDRLEESYLDAPAPGFLDPLPVLRMD